MIIGIKKNNVKVSKKMVLNEDCAELSTEEISYILYDFMLSSFGLDIDFDDLADKILTAKEFSEKTETETYKNNFHQACKDLAYKNELNKQDKRKQEFKEMVGECLTKGESRRFFASKTRNADYILELNLIESKDKKVEDYYD